nr:hypothetical protein [Streptomyces tsukubensis NRRL18488]
MSARSGFLKVEPVTGSAPPGRKSSAVAGKSANRVWLASVWARKVGSTVNPCRASFSAGLSSRASGRLPQERRTVSQVAGVPGVPTPSPLVWPWSKGMGRPFSRKREASAERGAVSRPSTVWTVRVRAS